MITYYICIYIYIYLSIYISLSLYIYIYIYYHSSSRPRRAILSLQLSPAGRSLGRAVNVFNDYLTIPKSI